MRRCAFCHRAAKLSGEHIWSEWINAILGPGRHYNFRRVDKNGNVLSQWPSHQLDLTAKVVCEPCNNEWMSDIEQKHAKPTLTAIINGSPFCVLPAGLVSTAIWAFKAAVLADHLQSSRPPFLPESVRTAFKRRLRIPHGVQMWLGAFHEPGTRNGVFKSHYIQLRDGRYKGFEYLVVTYGIAPLLIQVAACRWADSSKRPIDFPRLKQNPAWDEASIPFWPNTDAPISWPPRKFVGTDTINAFTYRWQNLRGPDS